MAPLLSKARPEDGWIPVPFLYPGSWPCSAAGLAVVRLTRRSARDPRWVARRIESKYPELGTGLLAAVEESTAPAGRRGYLQVAVVRQALDHRRGHDWDEVVPAWKLAAAKARPRRLGWSSWRRRPSPSGATSGRRPSGFPPPEKVDGRDRRPG